MHTHAHLGLGHRLQPVQPVARPQFLPFQNNGGVSCRAYVPDKPSGSAPASRGSNNRGGPAVPPGDHAITLNPPPQPPPGSAARLHSLNQTLLERLREEAAERAALQAQLLEAQAAAVRANLAAETAAAQLEQERKERHALQESVELQDINRTELSEAQSTVRALTQQLSEVRAELERAKAGDPSQQVAMERRVKVLEMQLESSERERRLEVAFITNNTSLAREQVAAATAAAGQLEVEVRSLRKANADMQLETSQQLHQLHSQLAATQAELVQLAPTQQQLEHQQALVAQLQQENQHLTATNLQLKQEAAEKLGVIKTMSQEVQSLRHRLAVTERTLAQRAAAAQALQQQQGALGPRSRSGSGPPGACITVNRYWTPPELQYPLMKALALREAFLQARPEFLAMTVSMEEEQVVVSVAWESREAFESWSVDRSQESALPSLPPGVMQYPPQNKGEGVPEPFLPWKQA